MAFDEWKPYVSVAQRRSQAAREVSKLRKQGHAAAPVLLSGSQIATTFWGRSWCSNLESYSDYANRLPRGRSYVRNGAVVDLQIDGGKVQAQVMGSRLYDVTVEVAPIPGPHWRSICNDCAGSIDTLVELLQGRLSKAVMERVCQQRTGLFPSPAEIALACSCPDWATMCKHVAAVLYGIGARLDRQPALVFGLRGVDEAELIAGAALGGALAAKGGVSAKVLDGDDLGELFGLDLETAPAKRSPPTREASSRDAPAKKASSKKKPAKQALGSQPVERQTTDRRTLLRQTLAKQALDSLVLPRPAPRAVTSEPKVKSRSKR